MPEFKLISFLALVLSKEKCALISSALDDCKIAACRDEDKTPIRGKGAKSDIPEGAICRIKCRSVKSQRCICCANGFEVGSIFIRTFSNEIRLAESVPKIHSRVLYKKTNVLCTKDQEPNCMPPRHGATAIRSASK